MMATMPGNHSRGGAVPLSSTYRQRVSNLLLNYVSDMRPRLPHSSRSVRERDPFFPELEVRVDIRSDGGSGSSGSSSDEDATITITFMHPRDKSVLVSAVQDDVFRRY